ncbi:STYKc [Musa troglodytarum]|uniref:STYKc n=1 Tax=Musa troglodytarum TaxID=320322 RepID=A0A9E7FSV9_9LILI|nr:STYKc [Musa troglodytarum]URE01754.1 STYKc [Musa troglodytarum]
MGASRPCGEKGTGFCRTCLALPSVSISASRSILAFFPARSTRDGERSRVGILDLDFRFAVGIASPSTVAFEGCDFGSFGFGFSSEY